jgi:hypothetical protein
VEACDKFCSDRFDAVSVDSNRNGSLQQFNGNDQALIHAMPFQDSFDTVKTSANDAYAIADFQEGMRVTRDLFSDGCPESFDFFAPNRSSLPFVSNETKHTGRP